MPVMFYRRDGTPYKGPNAFIEFQKDFEDMEKSRVAIDDLPNGVRVSTVWLGLDHNFGDLKRPQIFKSMVFAFEGDLDDMDCWRYATEEEARRGHKMLVKKWSVFKNVHQILAKKDAP